jgi:homoserine kinase type II
MEDESSNIFDEIKDTLECRFSLRVIDKTPIDKGLLNLKWKVETDNGNFFVKQFNSKRFPSSKLEKVKETLSYQNKLKDQAVCCPHVFSEGCQLIKETPKGIRFVVMEFCPGELVKAGRINEMQAYSLGFQCAKMHNLLNYTNNDKDISTWTIPNRQELIDKWDEKWNRLANKCLPEVIEILRVQRHIFENIDTMIFSKCKQGWAHSDLWCDNILFFSDRVSAILDFDRLQYIYPEFDIARALLSFALDNNHMRIEIVNAFIRGYNMLGSISMEDVVCSIKLLYCLESFWWIGEEFEINNGPPARFEEEMKWLTVNWDRLDKVLINVKDSTNGQEK